MRRIIAAIGTITALALILSAPAEAVAGDVIPRITKSYSSPYVAVINGDDKKCRLITTYVVLYDPIDYVKSDDISLIHRSPSGQTLYYSDVFVFHNRTRDYTTFKTLFCATGDSQIGQYIDRVSVNFYGPYGYQSLVHTHKSYVKRPTKLALYQERTGQRWTITGQLAAYPSRHDSFVMAGGAKIFLKYRADTRSKWTTKAMRVTDSRGNARFITPLRRGYWRVEFIGTYGLNTAVKTVRV